MTTHDHNQDAYPVRIVAGHPMAEHRADEARLITGVLAAVCALAAGCAILPALDNLVTALVLTTIAAVLGAGVVRWVIRRVRWWFEDHADARTAATWQAQHAHDAEQARQGVTRAGVA